MAREGTPRRKVSQQPPVEPIKLKRLVPMRLPADLLASIDSIVGPGGRTGFIVAAAERELVRVQQQAALADSAGAWADADHPELPETVEGMTDYLRKLREQAQP